MRFLSAVLISAAALAPLPVVALDFGNGFSLVGDVELEYVTSDGDDATFAIVDLTLGWRSQGGGALGFGFDLTAIAFENLDSNDGVDRLWGGLVLTTGFGDFTIGSPRPLFDTLSPAPEIGLNRAIDLELSAVEGPTLGIAALVSDDLDIYGISFRGEQGGFTYGAAVHQADDEDDTRIVELVGSYSFGAPRVYGGVELIDGDFSIDRLLFGGVYETDVWSVGAEFGRVSFFGDSIDIVQIFGDYEVIDGLTIGGQFKQISVGPDEAQIFGLSGEYSFGTGGFAHLGVTSVNDIFDQDFVNASVGFRF
jgi:hypothetical protein